MKFHGNLITEQGVKFGVIIVKPHVTKSRQASAEMQRFGQRAWGQLPIVLLGEDGSTFGRTDIVRFLKNVHPSQIPMREWKVAS